MSGALENSSTVPLLGFGVLNAQIKGGILVRNPDVLFFGLPTDGTGSFVLSTPWPAGVPSGLAVTGQHWVTDSSGPQGFAASNSLSLTAR